jgi:methionine-rich copper-binding protein CopC
MRGRAALAAAVLAFGALLASAPSASAHDKLRSTNPEQGSSVATTPAAITLTFNTPAFKIGSRIRVLGPAGDVAAGEPVFKDRTVRQPLQPGSPAGEYTVEWQVTSTDGHPIAGRWTFTALRAGTDAGTPTGTTPEPTTAPAEDPTPSPGATVSATNTGAETGGSPSTGIVVGVTAVVAVVLLAAAGGVALTRRRGG